MILPLGQGSANPASQTPKSARAVCDWMAYKSRKIGVKSLGFLCGTHCQCEIRLRSAERLAGLHRTVG